MPSSSPVMGIIVVPSRQDGGIWRICVSPCWNVSAVSVTWSRILLVAGKASALLVGCPKAEPSSAVEYVKAYASSVEPRAATLQSTVGLRTINERINPLEGRLAQVLSLPITDVPALVQFDGIWLSLQTRAARVSKRIVASASGGRN